MTITRQNILMFIAFIGTIILILILILILICLLINNRCNYEAQLLDDISDSDIIEKAIIWLFGFTKINTRLFSNAVVTGSNSIPFPNKHLNDSTFPTEYDKSKIIDIYQKYDKIYAFNLDRNYLTHLQSKKTIAIPIGIDFHSLHKKNMWGESKQSWIEQLQNLQKIRSLALPLVDRDPRILITWSNNSSGRHSNYMSREKLLEIYKSHPSCKYFSGKRTEMWKEMAKHAFVYSPIGNGFDSHRTWEAIALGCIVIAQTNPCIEEFTSQFPIILHNPQTDDLPSLQNLKNIIHEYKSTPWEKMKLNNFLELNDNVILMAWSNTIKNAEKYMMWELEVGMHRKSPKVVLLLTNDIPHESDIINLDLTSKEDILKLTKTYGNVKHRDWVSICRNRTYDIAVLGGLGPLASGVTAVQLAQSSPLIEIIICSLVRDHNHWEHTDEAFNNLNAERSMVACNTFHHTSKDFLKVKGELYSLHLSVYKYIKYREVQGKIALCGTNETTSPDTHYQNTLQEFNLVVDEDINYTCWKAHDAVIVSNKKDSVDRIKQAIEIAKHKNFKAIIFACTEFSVALHWLLEEIGQDILDNGDSLIIDPLWLTTLDISGCNLRWSNIINRNFCLCTNDNKYSKGLLDCALHIDNFSYLSGGWEAIDGCLSFMDTNTLNRTKKYAAELVNKYNVSGILELGPYSSPVSNFLPEMSGSNIILIDPLTRTNKVYHKNATILRMDFEDAIPLLESVNLGKYPMVIFLGAEIREKELIDKISNFIHRISYLFLIEASVLAECKPCDDTIQAITSKLTKDKLFKIVEEKTYNYSNLPKEEQTVCFHPNRRSLLFQRN